jgi:hypothetical protein
MRLLPKPSSPVAGIARKGFAVLSAISLVVWLVDWIVSQECALNFWLVLGLGFAVVTLLLWGLSQRVAAPAVGGVTHYHHYAGPTTVHYGASEQVAIGELPQPLDTPFIGGATASERETVRLSDYVEWSSDEPPTIRNRRFRYAKIRGPILVAPRRIDFRSVAFGVADNDPETIFWVLAPGETKTGVALLDMCTFEDCETEHVCFVGTREDLDAFRRGVEQS